MIPYGRQMLEEDDVRAVVEALRSDWLTTGPLVEVFEKVFADFVGAKYAVAVSSGTAALHTAMHAIGVGSGDEVIVSPMTFAASANCIVFQGATPIFADVDPNTLLISPAEVEAKLTRRTKAIIAVDYAGQPCDYDKLQDVAKHYKAKLVADACHSLGGIYKGKSVGSLAELNTFSFHPVKHITTGEGGIVTTDDNEFAGRMHIFRNHGIVSDHRQREQEGSWFYEMVDIGYNYRLTDFQCALGISQLKKFGRWIDKRREIAKCYDEAFADIPEIRPLSLRKDVSHAYHLYVVRLDLEKIGKSKQQIFHALRDKGIGVNVHYIPVHLHPFYRRKYNTYFGQCPVAEKAYESIISLPIFPLMRDSDVEKVIHDLCEVVVHKKI